MTPFTVVLLGVALTMAAGELFPAIEVRMPRFGRWAVNFGTGLAAVSISGFLTYASARPETLKGFLYGVTNSPVLRFLALLLLYDFLLWFWHRLNHETAWLWRWHRFHHLDPELDASSAWRFHPVEILVSGIWRVPLAMFIAADGTDWEWAAALATTLAVFHHGRFRLPVLADRLLSLVFVTPTWHHRHHHPEKKYNNSHYGVIFSFWDRLFGATAYFAGGFPIGLKGAPPSDCLSWKKLIDP